jgi:hypothetical protein
MLPEGLGAFALLCVLAVVAVQFVVDGVRSVVADLFVGAVL